MSTLYYRWFFFRGYSTQERMPIAAATRGLLDAGRGSRGGPLCLAIRLKITSPQVAPGTSIHPSHIEHTAAAWICWAVAHCAFRRQGATLEASRPSRRTVPRAPRQPLLIRTRLVVRIALLTTALPATRRFARRLAVAVRGRACCRHRPAATCATARSKTTATRLTVGNLAGPAGMGAATPGPRSADTKVLKKASLVFMSLLNDGSMQQAAARG
jgi:hypothetical protein